MNDFFHDTTPHQRRLEIIKKYQANFLLLHKARIAMWRTMVDSFAPVGRVVFENNQFILVSTASFHGTQNPPE